MSELNIRVDYRTPPCFKCGSRGIVYVMTHDLFDYLDKKKHVQDAFPYLSAGEREQIMTGTHPECWEKMFPEEDEDEQSE